MSRFEELYNSNPSEEAIRYLKEEFEFGSFSTSWEDYYWGVKCLTVYDNDNFNPDLLIGMLNNAFEYGLDSDSDKDCFIGAHRILACIYSILKDYEKTVEELSSIINQLDVVPAWIYYDYVSAQNHTSAIEDNMKEPDRFLKNLRHTDKTVSNASKRQSKIFKEFLVLAFDYISTNVVSQINLSPLKEAASEYGLLSTKEWINFEQIILSGDTPKLKSTDEETHVDDVVKVDSIDKRYQGILDKLYMIQEELDEKKLELKDANNSLSEVLQMNNILEDRIRKYNDDILEYELALKDKDAEISSLFNKLNNALEGSNEKIKLEEDLSVVKKQRDLMKNQIYEIKNALIESEKNLNDTNDELTKKINENKKLKDELNNVKNRQITFSASVSADILAKCKAFEYVTTNKLADWLTKNLSYYNNWWQNFVMRKISYSQAERAIYYQDLHDFDLAALIRITVNNWNLLRNDNLLTKTDEDVSKRMFGVRNNLSHNNAKPVIKESIIRDLQTLSDFLGMINAKAERYQVMLYINEVAKMQIA